MEPRKSYPLLRYLMRSQGRTQADLAKMLGCSLSYVEAQFQERGKGFTVPEARRILKVMNIHETWLAYVFDAKGPQYRPCVNAIYEPLRSFADLGGN